MSTVMVSVEPHWQGDTFIPPGTFFDVGDPEVIDAFFETVEYGDNP